MCIELVETCAFFHVIPLELAENLRRVLNAIARYSAIHGQYIGEDALESAER